MKPSSPMLSSEKQHSGDPCALSRRYQFGPCPAWLQPGMQGFQAQVPTAVMALDVYPACSCGSAPVCVPSRPEKVA